MESVVLFIAGILVGAAVLWFVIHSKISTAYQKANLENAAKISELVTRIEGLQKDATRLAAELSAQKNLAADLAEENSLLRSKISETNARLDEERQKAKEKLALLDEARHALTDAFKSLSSDALRNNNQAFLDLAKSSLSSFQEVAKGDLELRQQAIHQMITPVKESLARVDTKIQELETARAGAYGALTAQVAALLDSQASLRNETANLTKALRAPHVRGRWGEVQLKRVVEMAGMLDYCDFYEQVTAHTEAGAMRPDLLIKLPGNKNIIVDSKVPLSHYLDSLELEDGDARTQKLNQYAELVRTHMTALGRKAYWSQFDPTPEFVILFLPGEAFHSAALQQNPALLEESWEKKVLVATPTTLIAVLKAISYGWRQEAIARNATEISNLGNELYQRLAVMIGHYTKLGRSLTSSVEHYNRALGTFESRVLITARKFKDLGSTVGNLELPELLPIEVSTRSLVIEDEFNKDVNLP